MIKLYVKSLLLTSKTWASELIHTLTFQTWSFYGSLGVGMTNT